MRPDLLKSRLRCLKHLWVDMLMTAQTNSCLVPNQSINFTRITARHKSLSNQRGWLFVSWRMRPLGWNSHTPSAWCRLHIWCLFISSCQSPCWHQGNPLISGAQAYGDIYSGNAYKCVRHPRSRMRRGWKERGEETRGVRGGGGGRGGGKPRVAAVPSGGSGDNLQSVSPGSLSPTSAASQIRAEPSHWQSEGHDTGAVAASIVFKSMIPEWLSNKVGASAPAAANVLAWHFYILPPMNYILLILCWMYKHKHVKLCRYHDSRWTNEMRKSPAFPSSDRPTQNVF